jgi:Tol biopolymer transport system component
VVFRGALVAALVVMLLSAAPARATDSLAPPGALPNWIPPEDWVFEHWLPYDEGRLYRLLRTDRGALWRYLRDDTRHTMAQLARNRGLSAEDLASRLVAPRRAAVGPRTISVLRERALRTLTQGHLSQHLLFHSLHQTATLDRARWIFGARPLEFQHLRLRDMSPLDIAHLFGHDAVLVRRRAAATLRSMARRGVAEGAVSRRQAATLVARQLRQLPRWLGQRRNNGPPPQIGPSTPLLPVADFANHPSISADGSHVAWDAYRAKIPEARRLGEIHVVVADRRTGHRVDLPGTAAPGRLPRSFYNNSLSADGRTLATESSAGNLNFGKRYGRMEVALRPLGGHRPIAVRADARRTGSAFNPTLSGDGGLVAFELSSGTRAPDELWLFDRSTRHAQRVARGTAGSTYEPRLSSNGAALVFTMAEDGLLGHSEVYRRSLTDGVTTLVSRANGPGGAPADGDAGEPAVSGDGTVVAFSADASNLGAAKRAARIYVRDVARARTEIVGVGASTFAFDPALSGDGRFVAFAARPRRKDGTADPRRASIYVHDRLSGRTALVSRNAKGGRAGGESSEPALSQDGQLIAFTSDAADLDPRKPAGITGVFVRDLRTGHNDLLSRHPFRAPGGGAAHATALCVL